MTALATRHPRGVDISKLSREQWLELRRKSIGASDAAAAVGLNPYMSEYRLWGEKTGALAPEDLSKNLAVRLGNLLEPVVAEIYEEQTGRKVRRVNQMLYHPEHQWMHANLDRRVVGERRIVELKTAGDWVARKDFGDADDDVPVQYLLQVQHQLAITGDPIGDLAVLISNQELRVYSIPRDEELIADLIAREHEFWDLVERNEPPAARDLADLMLRYPNGGGVPVEATNEIAVIMDDLADAKHEIKLLEERVESLKFDVCSYMGDSERLTYLGADLATWKPSKPRKYIDAKRLEAERPEIFAEYSVTAAPARPFLIKEAGSK
jgi:putative phage-type endonuclease